MLLSPLPGPRWFVANEAFTYMTDALLTEAPYRLFNKFPEANKKVMTEALDCKPIKFNFSSKWLHKWKKHCVENIKTRGGGRLTVRLVRASPMLSCTYQMCWNASQRSAFSMWMSPESCTSRSQTNQRYIEDKEVIKGDAQMQSTVDHVAEHSHL